MDWASGLPAPQQVPLTGSWIVGPPHMRQEDWKSARYKSIGRKRSERGVT